MEENNSEMVKYIQFTTIWCYQELENEENKNKLLCLKRNYESLLLPRTIFSNNDSYYETKDA
jgi:hypothetical protein